MKERTIKLYSFDELPEKSKDKVMEKHRYDIAADSEEYDWNDMWEPTIKRFEKIFSVKLNISSRYGWTHNIEMKEEYFFDNGMWFNDKDFNGKESIRFDELCGIQLLRYIGAIFREHCEKGKYYFTGGKYVEINGKNVYTYKSRYSKIMKEWDNCPLTGTCSDHSILEPIAQYLNLAKGGYGFKNEDGTFNISWKSYTYEDLMEACADSIIKEIESSIDFYSSDEYISEEIENRFPDVEYFENGDEFLGELEI